MYWGTCKAGPNSGHKRAGTAKKGGKWLPVIRNVAPTTTEFTGGLPRTYCRGNPFLLGKKKIEARRNPAPCPPASEQTALDRRLRLALAPSLLFSRTRHDQKTRKKASLQPWSLVDHTTPPLIRRLTFSVRGPNLRTPDNSFESTCRWVLCNRA